MPRFKFKLQPVLDQREREEREKQLAVALLERERLALESRIRMCQRMMEDERITLSAALGTGQRVDLKAVKMQAGASLKHNFEAQRTVLELAGVFRKLQGARRELASAAARRKAVELLRDQQLEAFNQDLKMKESHELDEMSVMRFGRTDGIRL
ncbi:MAG: flagellar FliJ family protein [Phycisphaerales bacterium]|nr:flagellar FliJ family protein [Phycisphaerales bacterium]